MPRTALAIAHDIPGRLRLRVPPVAEAGTLAETIGRQDGVVSCQWAPRTGSLLIRYQPALVSADELVEAVASHMGIEIADADTGASSASGETPPLGAVVTGAVTEVNVRLSRATAGRLNLALALPIGLTVWALFDVMRGPIRPLAWTTALWYAHGLFRDYALPDSHR